jgi:hypothetical protein
VRHPPFIVVEVFEVEVYDRELTTKRITLGLKIFEVIDNSRNKNGFTWKSSLASKRNTLAITRLTRPRNSVEIEMFT